MTNHKSLLPAHFRLRRPRLMIVSALAGALTCIGLALATLTGPAQRKEAATGPMQLQIRERLWDDPGSVQSAPDAPRLLIVYPFANAPAEASSVWRFAGRVEPTSATVTLNNVPLTIYPGGIFIGMSPLKAGTRETWRFEAGWKGRKTAVERVVRRLAPSPSAPPWPLAFFSDPVYPTGDYWLPQTAELRVTLYASAGHRAQARIGEKGPWLDMQSTAPNPGRGGSYRITLHPPRPVARFAGSAIKPQIVYFRLTGQRDGESQTRELCSSLRIATVPRDRPLIGLTTGNLVTFRKTQTSGSRWGNWLKGTPFPILEGRGNRFRTGFGHGETGWIEMENSRIDPTLNRLPRLELGTPRVGQQHAMLTLAWPKVARPVACAFYHELHDPGKHTLRVSLPGAGDLAPFRREFRDGPFEAAVGSAATGSAAPVIDIILREPLWGFTMDCNKDKGLSLMARTRPRLEVTSDKPLQGLRVMLDAGHGGANFGGRGPSGLIEKDINLVQAAWLECDLKELGAEVRQTRRTDVDVNLDRRVDMAVAWAPDLFISLHHNSVPVDVKPLSISGPTVYYHYPHSQPLARAIAEVMSRAAGTPARVFIENFRVNRNVSFCPSVLVESAFLSNPKDEYMLRRTETIRAEARAVAEGIRNYMTGQ